MKSPRTAPSSPLFFHLSGTYSGTNDVTVRARFIGGTATPGVDFDDSQPVRRFEASTAASAGLAWIPLPLIGDESDEGTETAVFELTVDGGNQPPVRVEVDLLDDMQAGEVGFVSPRFQVNEGSTNGFAQVRLWRTLDTRRAATVDLLLEGSTNDLAVLGVPTRFPVTFQPGESQIFVPIPLVDDKEAQGVRTVTLRIDPAVDGVRVMRDFGTTVLTVADDETPGLAAPVKISEFESEDGRRGVMVSTSVPRGYKARLEYSESGMEGPWNVAWIIEGADTERFVFDSYETSAVRMYRLKPPEPLDLTFPW